MKERIGRVFVFLLGVGWILGTVVYKKLGFSANTWTDLDSIQFYGPGTISGISLGVAMILVAIFSRAISFYVAVWSIVGGITLLCADNLLYLASPWLPRPIVQLMSEQAQDKYLNFHPEVLNGATEGRVWFYKPGTVRDIGDGRTIIYDELGYNNPPGYLAGLQGADILVFGDSLVEVGLLPEILRELLAPVTIYGMGIGGQGPPRWRWHFQRYIKSTFYHQPPKVVVLTFTSGSDLSNTKTYFLHPDIPKAIIKISAMPAWPTRRFSFFGELLSIVQKTVFTRLWAVSNQYWQYSDFEPDLDAKDSGWQETVLTLTEMVEDIRKAAPSVKILISYWATSGAIYSVDQAHCLEVGERIFSHRRYFRDACTSATLKTQARVSQKLREWADIMGVYYVDPTSELQEAGRTSILHSDNDIHLNREGTRIYASAIVHRIEELGLLTHGDE